MIYATDFIDGKIARKFSACSNIGAVFDVLADLLFLLASGIAFITIGTYPAWMLTVLIGKFLEFCCTSVYVKKSNSDQQNVFTFDKLGRKVVILIYALPCISIILQSLIPYVWILPVMNLLCIPITIGAMVSSIQRIKVCIRVKDTIYT
jgi:CDP-diacylglycerol--glycerol-3-phosphate 3-phosphatidyltransferase